MWKRRIKIAACVLCFCALMVGVGKGLRYVLQDDADSTERLKLHELYTQDGIDVLFVGSSHCDFSFVPYVLDEELHQSTFNAGSSEQRMDGSLMMIREAAKYHDLKHVYLDIYFNVVDFGRRKDRTELYGTFVVSDQFRPSWQKLRYQLNASGPAHYANAFIVARRNAIKLFDLDYVQLNLQRKSTEQYRTYGYTDQYVHKGYLKRPYYVPSWNYFLDIRLHDKSKTIDIPSISHDWEEDLFAVIDFCQSQGIELTLLSVPTTDYMLSCVKNYDAFRTYFQKLIEGKGVEYYDFNLCREAYFPSRSELYFDDNHLNVNGAELFSHLLGRFINGELSPDELFYDSYADKLAHMPPTVFGVNFETQTADDGTPVRVCEVVSSAPDKLECEITIEQDGEAPLLVQPYARSTSFQLDPDEKGTCVIRYRSIDDPAAEYETRLTIP